MVLPARGAAAERRWGARAPFSLPSIPDSLCRLFISLYGKTGPSSGQNRHQVTAAIPWGQPGLREAPASPKWNSLLLNVAEGRPRSWRGWDRSRWRGCPAPGMSPWCPRGRGCWPSFQTRQEIATPKSLLLLKSSQCQRLYVSSLQRHCQCTLKKLTKQVIKCWKL